MTVALTFLLVGLLLLALLGRASLPYRERLPIRQWTGQDWLGNIGRGLRLLADAGGRRSAIMTQLTEEDLRKRRKRQDRQQDGTEPETPGDDARP